MEMKKIILLTIIGLIVIIGGGAFLSSISYTNNEVELRQEAKAQKGKIEAKFDQTWKIISQQAQIASSYKDSFKEIYVGIMEGRYSKGDGSLMKWIQESNPKFDTRLYEKLMNSIEVQRESFTTEQSRMLDIIREHDVLCNTIPGKWFISDEARKTIEYTVISSTKTKKAVETGIDDDVDLGLK